MRSVVILRLLAAATLIAFGIGVASLSRIDFSAPPPPATFADLTAPLPADSEADFADTLSVIEEFRLRRGSLLDGTLLADGPAPPLPADNSYVELLRREARRLDGHAADLEEHSCYDQADAVREEAGRLRGLARENVAQPQQFSTTVNR